MQILHGLRLVYEDQNKAHATKVPMLSKMELNLDQLEIQLRKEKIIKIINYLKKTRWKVLRSLLLVINKIGLQKIYPNKEPHGTSRNQYLGQITYEKFPDQFRFLEAPFVRQADGDFKNANRCHFRTNWAILAVLFSRQLTNISF